MRGMRLILYKEVDLPILKRQLWGSTTLYAYGPVTSLCAANWIIPSSSQGWVLPNEPLLQLTGDSLEMCVWRNYE